MRRVATDEQLDWAVRRYGPDRAARELTRRGLMPPVAGAAGWSLGNGAPNSNFAASVTNGTNSLAFTGNPTQGDVIVCGAYVYDGTGSTTYAPTFSDLSSNVTSWNSAGNTFRDSNVGSNITVGWGVATGSGPCTPKVVWNTGTTSVDVIVWILDVVPPAGTPAQDGSTTMGYFTDANVTQPAGGGSGNNDLLINVIGVPGELTNTPNSPWTLCDSIQSGNAMVYALNSAGNTAPNWTGSGSKYQCVVVAIKAAVTSHSDAPSGRLIGAGAIAENFTPGNQILRPSSDIATTGWTSTPLYSKINDQSDATFIQATLS